jgi:nucleoside 2-deoxyribosyltransferase
MNIYFALSITGGRQDEAIYQHIVQILQGDGHQIPTAMLAEPGIDSLERDGDPEDVYQRDTGWIKSCDVLIAEISTPSHGVGYEIGYALNLGMPVLCLHRQGVGISKMISGNPHPHLKIKTYEQQQDIAVLLRDFLGSVERS